MLKRQCRKYERQFKRHKNTAAHCIYIEHMAKKSKLFAEKRNLYWNHLVCTHKDDPKKLWSVVDKILCRSSYNNMTSDNSDNTANDFIKFFKEKIDKVKQSMLYDARSLSSVNADDVFPLSVFREYSEDDIKDIIMKSPNKTCLLDIVPTCFFKKYIFLFLSFMIDFINLCFRLGKLPACFKHAIVTPLLKKSNLEESELNNYRPISNLSFISKVIERVVAKELKSHMEKNNLMPMYQSGYRHLHSTETALLHVTSELFEAVDSQKVCLIAFLDLSAAFDCVDLDILFQRLFNTYCIQGTVAQWFRSYLFDRTQ